MARAASAFGCTTAACATDATSATATTKANGDQPIRRIAGLSGSASDDNGRWKWSIPSPNSTVRERTGQPGFIRTVAQINRAHTARNKGSSMSGAAGNSMELALAADNKPVPGHNSRRGNTDLSQHPARYQLRAHRGRSPQLPP